MKPTPWFGGLALLLAAPVLFAQTPTAPRPAPPAATTPAPADSGLDGLTFYQLLLGEMNLQSGEPGASYSLMLDAARKGNSEQLYQRAVEIALQSRSGDAALQAARAWKQAFPQSRSANRFVLQILVALNRVPESAEPLKAELTGVTPDNLPPTLAAIIRTYARVSDKKLAASVIEQALKEQLANPASAAISWATVGRLRLAAGDNTGALDAATRGRAADRKAEAPIVLALDLIDPKTPQAEVLVKEFLAATPDPDIRLAYARALIDAQRFAEATEQLQIGIGQQPNRPESWLILGVLQLQDNQPDPAEKSLKRYLDLSESMMPEERKRGAAQAYLSLAQIAEKRRDYSGAEAWLMKIDNPQDATSAQFRRASILAKQGKMNEARQLIRSLPTRTPAEARQKLMAEVQLLRENKLYKDAHAVLGKALVAEPKDTDLLYDQALIAEKMGALDEMERLLRRVTQIKPDAHHAYNALGYSLAERNVRLPEARQLIQKALEYAPGDPFIRDSLGWVEFRMGNKDEALKVLEAAYKARPDAEIAAHYGEVLWSAGQRDRAQAIWKEGLMLNATNETLLEVLKRLKVKL